MAINLKIGIETLLKKRRRGTCIVSSQRLQILFKRVAPDNVTVMLSQAGHGLLSFIEKKKRKIPVEIPLMKVCAHLCLIIELSLMILQR